MKLRLAYNAGVHWNYSNMLSALLLTACGLGWVGNVAPTSAWAGETSHVEVRLISDVAAVTPGTPFHLGLLYTIEPGWHIYWINPGDAGMATEATLKGPVGFTITGPHWPTPHRFDDPGGIVANGYVKQVLLWWTVTPADDWKPSLTGESGGESGDESGGESGGEKALTFTAATNWLACREACVLGKAQVSLTLPTGPTEPSSDAVIFGEARAATPVEADATDSLATVTTQTVGNVIHVSVAWKLAVKDIEVFTGNGADVAVDDLTVETKTEGALSNTIVNLAPRLLVKSSGNEGTRPSFPLVIAYRIDKDQQTDTRRALTIPINVPPHLPESTKASKPQPLESETH